MPATYTLIASNTLANSTTSAVSFSAIPSTYTDLVVRYSARSTDTGSGGQSMVFQLNGSSTSDYSMTLLRATASTASSVRYSADTRFYSYVTINADGTTANTFSSGELYVPNYAGSANKAASHYGVMENNNSTTWYMDASAFLRSNTAAITQITLSVSGYNFKSGSSFFLYGIKNS
jgi:hypothetical protein